MSGDFKSAKDPRPLPPHYPSVLQPVEAYPGNSVVRVLASNPSAMTLDGTNSYLLWDRGSGRCIVLDPGPSQSNHIEALLNEVKNRELTLGAVLLTHHHFDHSESAFSLAKARGIPLYAHRDAFPGRAFTEVPNYGSANIGGVGIEIIPTPGHCGDHLAFRTEEGALLTGDHVLGRGTSVVTSPDGNLTDYLNSLEKLRTLEYTIMLPGHGPHMTFGLASEVIAYYISHRMERLSQILEVLGQEIGQGHEPTTIEVITDVIYGSEILPQLRWAAMATTESALAHLISQNVVRRHLGGFVLSESG